MLFVAKLATFMSKVQPSLCKFLFDSCVLEMLPISEFVLVAGTTTAVDSEGIWSESLRTLEENPSEVIL
jgi:hypothetical protein